MTVQAVLCQTCSETTLLVFPRGGSNLLNCSKAFLGVNGMLHFGFADWVGQLPVKHSCHFEVMVEVHKLFDRPTYIEIRYELTF